MARSRLINRALVAVLACILPMLPVYFGLLLGGVEQVYSVISTKTLREHLYRPFPNFTRQRVQRGIQVRVIAIGEGGDEAELAERKWLPGGEGSDASYIAIYPPKVAIITLASRNYPVVIIIDSPAIASTQQLLFDTLWSLL